ncbi:hypothetical protein F0562_018801 [Nyssa sinensis]|uniref:Uncharacterized protein n=1 Tax=Nyssa sinensis TaxID=561372 RepID=A0A5J4ZDI3_9ASTE|nr:hypothetical protein F0562_018801 [Nyssa sinensis]
MNEALMELLQRLDSVSGVDTTVRELRQHLSRRIVGLQEILDAVTDERVEDWGGFLRNWDDDDVANIEEEVGIERGGHEMERFSAENLGFRCLQRSHPESSAKASFGYVIHILLKFNPYIVLRLHFAAL